MGMAAGEAIVTACDYAKKNNSPLIIFSSSGGARMQGYFITYANA